MIKFKFQKISQIPKSFFRERREITDYIRELRKIQKEKNYNLPEGFLILPTEKINFLKEISKNIKKVFVVGIGGSSLGAQAVYEALKNKKKKGNKVFFFDSLNPLFLRSVLLELRKAHLEKGEIGICFISESGKTFETIANFFALFKKIKRYKPEIFVITDEGSPLWRFSQKKNWQIFSLRPPIVGRYSVFSTVGLLPLALRGANIQELLLGAQEANEICLRNSPIRNPALASALTIFYHWQKRRNIYSNFVFPPDLEFFGRWYCQLMGESLGKNGRGITPTVTVGTTDFHSLGQLYFDGPKDKLINFVFVEKLDSDFEIPKGEDINFLFPGAERKKMWDVNRAIFEGVKKAYFFKKLPFTATILNELTERSLGNLFQMKMIEIVLLAKLMKVNAFDQPGVELYKKETREILKRL